MVESCGTAHFWARQSLIRSRPGTITPSSFPPSTSNPIDGRNKSDRIDTEALLEAHRCAGIRPVPVRSVDQQQLQQLHRIREQWKKTRTARINALRGFLRELGHPIAEGAANAKRQVRIILDDGVLPEPLRAAFSTLLDEVLELEQRMKRIEQQLHQLTKDRNDVRVLRQVHGIGLLTSTALVASAGSPHHFPSERHFASWLGITPREFSSGNRRFLGRISKQGDKYLRTLIVHGARSVLARAKQLQKTQQPLSRLHRWALQLEQRVGHNKATVALANKLARICWAVWKTNSDFNPEHISA